MSYKFDWDPAKAARNLKDHKVAFEEASTVFGDPLAMLMADPDHSEDEERYLLLGTSIRRRLLVVSFAERPPLTRVEANYLFQVVTARYERSSLILTSNKAVTEWPELFGDHAIATAILDRILHHAHVFSIKGNSYRLRERLVQTTPSAPAPLSPLPNGPTEGR